MRPSATIPLAALLAALRPGQAFTIPEVCARAVLGVSGRLAACRGLVFDLEVDGSMTVRRPVRGRAGAVRRRAERRMASPAETPKRKMASEGRRAARGRASRAPAAPPEVAPAVEGFDYLSPASAEVAVASLVTPSSVPAAPEPSPDPVVEKAKTWGGTWSKPGRLRPPAIDPAVKRLAGGV